MLRSQFELTSHTSLQPTFFPRSQLLQAKQPGPRAMTPRSGGPIERAIANALRRQAASQAAQKRDVANGQVSSDVPDINEVTPPQAAAKAPRRRVSVNLLSTRYAVTEWMIREAEENGDRHITSKAVQNFPQHFVGTTNAKLAKASRWWKQREITMALKTEKRRSGMLTSECRRSARKIGFKALKGRGRKRAKWVQHLYADLLREFERLRSVGLKFSSTVLRDHARFMIESAPPESENHKSVLENNKLILEKITVRWVQHFMCANSIVLRAQTGKLLVSPLKESIIEKSVAFHLGELKRGFQSGLLREECIENADETHFIFNMDNGKTLGFKGDRHVKYADVVSGGDPITMMVRISGGVNARIEAPMLIFKNQNGAYPIRGVADNVPGVCYRTGPHGWMDSRVFCEWLLEPRAVGHLREGKQMVLYVDNCSSHNSNVSVGNCLRQIRTTMQKLPPNATHLVQPADSFIIQKIKEEWRARWDAYKYDAIRNGDWQQTADGKGSGKLRNPGKRFFLQLAADAVRAVNAQKDSNGVSYARKAMVMTGMSLNYNGLWEESQLTSDLQEIIARNRRHFDGEPVDMAADAGSECDSDQ